MVSLEQFQGGIFSGGQTAVQYRCRYPLNLYDSPALTRLATQAVAGRYLRGVAQPTEASAAGNEIQAVAVCLCEDDYPGWLAVSELEYLEVATTHYQPVALSEAEIQARIPGAIAFVHAAMTYPNRYLWGGTVGPNFDCSGLVQTAFASMGIWLPRDAYQQEAFTHTIELEDLHPGDLVFFGTPQKATHVGVALGEARYIHSSGQEQGNNGIAIDVLSDTGNPISQTYYAQRRKAGRIHATYQPTITL